MESRFGKISITETIRHITRILLSESDIDKGVNHSLEVLQGATNVDRVYIFEMWRDDKRGNMARQIFEHCAPGVTPEIDNPLLLDLEMDHYFSRWLETFNRDSWISGHIEVFPMEEREVLTEQGILSLLVIPIKAENSLVGFMGFDSTSSKRDWRLEEVELLIESSVLIGTMLIRRRQEAKIRAEELKYTNLFQKMSDGVVYHDHTGQIVHFNNAACEILGLTPDQLLGRSSIDPNWRTIKEDGSDYSGDQHPAMVAIKSGKTVQDVTMGVFDTNRNEYRWILVTAMPEINKDTQQIEGVYAIFKDISTRVHYENELKEAKRTAEEVSRLKSNIMANIGHEFRTPITGILGFANLISEQAESQKLQDAAKFIGLSANRLHHTLESLLEYSYLDSNAIEYRPKHIVLSVALRSVLEESRQQAETKKLDFSYNFLGDDLVYCDERYLKTILRQLLSNAVKFTDKGSIAFEFHVNEDSFVMSVIDTGIGISDHHYNYLFEPFVQASDGIGRGFEGSGLGLPIVKRLVEKLNGVIHIDSNSKNGTTFTISIPRQKSSDGGHYNESRESEKNEATSILYIEDNPVLRKLAAAMLDEYDLVCVPTAELALDALNTKSFGLFLIDINLGTGMNGIEFARILRNNPVYNKTTLVAITAYSLDQIDEAGGNGLFDHYISKPFTPDDLLTFIQSELGSTVKKLI
jgi:PAS domain S-box-containing protein